MLFNSGQFIIFFPIVVILYFAFPAKIRNYWLLVASYYFYMCWNPKYIVLLITSTLVTYTSGLLMERVKQQQLPEHSEIVKKNWIVAFSFIINIGLLFYFKYTNFAIDTLRIIFNQMGIELDIPNFDIVLPVGISFYIFQSLSYTMDVYRDEIYAEKNVFRYALFVSFFPQLVAGPIERSKNLLRQLATPGKFDYEQVRSGLLTMLWGFFLKLVIADRAAILVDNVYTNVREFKGLSLAIASSLFALQIYCDFMSYSTIAKGAARVLGYGLMDNFDTPYFAVSIKDFWSRWHISLSTWLRDYLYIPLGGNRRGRLRKYFNIIITFFVSGLWHGASFTFIVWGLLHGFYQIIEDILKPIFHRLLETIKIDKNNKLLIIVEVMITFVLVDIAWVFFRANTLSDGIYVIKNAFIWHNKYSVDEYLTLGLDVRNTIMLSIATIILFVSSLLKRTYVQMIDWVSTKKFYIRYAMYWTCVSFIIFSLDIGGAEFIYFQF